MQIAVLLVLFCTIVLGTHGVLWCIGNNTTASRCIYRLETLDQQAVANGAPVILVTDHPVLVDHIDIVSSLAFGHAIPQGAEVAEIVLEDMKGNRYRTVMRAGVDTAEQSFQRPEHAHLLRHSVDETHIVRYFITHAYSSSYHDLLLFHYQWDLPHPLFVKKIRIRYIYPFGRLYLADIFLRSGP